MTTTALPPTTAPVVHTEFRDQDAVLEATFVENEPGAAVNIPARPMWRSTEPANWPILADVAVVVASVATVYYTHGTPRTIAAWVMSLSGFALLGLLFRHIARKEEARKNGYLTRAQRDELAQRATLAAAQEKQLELLA